MKTNWFSFILAILALIIFIYLGIAWEIYKYHDCKKVGHSTFYCVMQGGK